MDKSKRMWSAEESRDIANIMQGWILHSLSRRRQEYGKWAFHGGTALKQAYAYERFSEDLDFMTSPGLDMSGVMADVVQDVELNALQAFGRGTTVSLRPGKEEHNPSVFNLVLVAPHLSPSNVRVKVEFWETEHFPVYVSVTTETSGQAARIRGAVIHAAPTELEVGSLEQIYIDKWLALTVRPYVKPRDLWDLSWLLEREGLRAMPADTVIARMETLSHCYNTRIEEWPAAAQARLALLRQPDYCATFREDMLRWLSEPYVSHPLSYFQARLSVVVSVFAELTASLEKRINDNAYHP